MDGGLAVMPKKSSSGKASSNKTPAQKSFDKTEYSKDLTPVATGRLMEAGYGKSTDFELAEIGDERTKEQAQKQARTEDEIYNARDTMKDVVEPAPVDTADRPIKGTQQNYELGDMETRNTTAGPKENKNFAGFETKANTARENAQAHNNFEFGAINEKTNLPEKPNKRNQ